MIIRIGVTRMRTPAAVLACLDAGAADGLRALLSGAGYAVAAEACSVPGALAAVRAHRPALLLADAILPGGDGASLLRQVFRLPLERYPDVVLTAPAGGLPFAVCDETPGAAIVARPVTPDALEAAMRRCRSDPGALPPERAARLCELLDRLGVPPHPGREMLFRAAALAWRDRRRLSNLQADVYPEAARPFGRSAAQAERAVRHVIEAAWRRGDIEAQHRIFGDTIDARRGRPTCGEMIAQLADILRWEG